MLRTIGMMLGSVVACTSGGDDTAEPPEITNGTITETCGGVEPVADTLLIDNGGVRNFEGDDYPTISLELHLTDEDGDLHQGKLQFWHDEVLDGTVDDSGDPDADRIYSEMGETCFSFEMTVRLAIQVGTVFDYNTPYEFAALFIDADGDASNVLVEAGVTPKEDGSDGDPLE